MSSPISAVGNDGDAVKTQYAARMARESLDLQQQEGQDAVQLIASAATQPPAPSEGKGDNVNTYA